MANKEDLGVVEFGASDLKTLEELNQQVNACKTAAEKSGRSASVLTVFLRMIDEKFSAFTKDLRERMKAAARPA